MSTAADIGERKAFRRKVLAQFGADGADLEELLRYNENVFQIQNAELPLSDESFVPVWESYLAEAAEKGLWAVLREKLVELHFPIEAGISETETYHAAKRRGVVPAETGPGLRLQEPEQLTLCLHPTAVGRIPILTTTCREDFVALVRALLRRNEPAPLLDSVGAYMVSGYNNWDRVRALKKQWEIEHPAGTADQWSEAFRLLAAQKELYQDRFILLSDGPYSGVSAAEMGLDEAAWRRASLIIRREHECVHYFTCRLFGSARNNLLDELIADFVGLKTALGQFRAEWFLRFLGLEDPTQFRVSGRLGNYRGDPPLSERSFGIVQRLVAAAGQNLQTFDDGLPSPPDLLCTARWIAASASLTLEEFASKRGTEWLADGLRKATKNVRPSNRAPAPE